MKQYLVTAEDEAFNNRDLFVNAETPSQAVEYAFKHWEDNDCERSRLTTDGKLDVFEVPTMVTNPGVIAWDSVVGHYGVAP